MRKVKWRSYIELRSTVFQEAEGEGIGFLAVSSKRSDEGLHLEVNLQEEAASPGRISLPPR